MLIEYFLKRKNFLLKRKITLLKGKLLSKKEYYSLKRKNYIQKRKNYLQKRNDLDTTRYIIEFHQLAHAIHNVKCESKENFQGNMDSNEKVKCTVCKKQYKHILKHLEYSEACKDDYPLAGLKRLNIRLTVSEKCFICQKKVNHILKHLAKSKSCKQNYPMDQLKDLKEDSIKRKVDYQRNYKKEHQKDQKEYTKKHLKIKQKRQYQTQKSEEKKDISIKLKNFFQDIKYGPIFPCVCCCRDMFKRGVKVVTDDFKKQLEDDTLISCLKLEDGFLVDGDHYICLNCHRVLKNKKKMPDICYLNGLGLSDVPDCLKLTDLENQLVARNLVFIKIEPSPRSRYDTMKDRIINIPIGDEDIIKTVDSLPRSQDTNGLIQVKLKRKLEYKKPYKHQFVRHDKLIEAVKYLKVNHPSYSNIQISDISLDSENLDDAKQSENSECNSSSENESETFDSHASSSESDSSSSSDLEDEGNSQYNDITCVVPEEPQTTLVINSSGKPIHKKTKQSSKILHEIAPGKESAVLIG